MVAISFSVFKDKILSGEKTQTTRPWNQKRYEQIKRIRKLQLYWHQRRKDSELLKEVDLEDIFAIGFSNDAYHFLIFRIFEDGSLSVLRRTLPHEAGEIVYRDGFSSFNEMKNWFFERYGPKMNDMPFMVVRWNPPIWGASTTAAGGW